MIWNSYGFNGLGNGKPIEDTRTKEDLIKEITNLISENRTLWFMLKERCPDLSYEELTQKVDNKIKEENDRIEKGRKFIEQNIPTIIEADKYFGGDYGNNKLSLRMAYFLSKQNSKLDNDILSKNINIARQSDDEIMQMFTIVKLVKENKEYINSLNLGDDAIMYLISLCGSFNECDEINKGGTD